MRRLWTGICLGAVLSGSAAFGQEAAPPPPAPEQQPEPFVASPAKAAPLPTDAYRDGFVPSHRRMSMADEILFERATFRARQRIARTETRKWQGVTMSRPQDFTGFGTTEQFQYRPQAWYVPYVVPGWYAGPVGPAVR